MVVYHEVLASEHKPPGNKWVMCIDINKHYRVCRWDGKKWQARDANTSESPEYAAVWIWLDQKITHNQKRKN